MPRKLECTHCKKTIVTFLRVGEFAECRECGQRSRVNADAAETEERPSWALGRQKRAISRFAAAREMPNLNEPVDVAQSVDQVEYEPGSLDKALLTRPCSVRHRLGGLLQLVGGLSCIAACFLVIGAAADVLVQGDQPATLKPIVAVLLAVLGGLTLNVGKSVSPLTTD